MAVPMTFEHSRYLSKLINWRVICFSNIQQRCRDNNISVKEIVFAWIFIQYHFHCQGCLHTFLSNSITETHVMKNDIMEIYYTQMTTMTKAST